MIKHDIIDAMLDGASTTEQIAACLPHHPEGSIRAALSRMAERGLIERQAHGVYALADCVGELMSDERHAVAVALLLR